MCVVHVATKCLQPVAVKVSEDHAAVGAILIQMANAVTWGHEGVLAGVMSMAPVTIGLADVQGLVSHLRTCCHMDHHNGWVTCVAIGGHGDIWA